MFNLVNLEKRKMQIIDILMVVFVYIVSFVIVNNFINSYYGPGDYLLHIEAAMNGNGYSLMQLIFRLSIKTFKTINIVPFVMATIYVLISIVCSWFIKVILELFSISTNIWNLYPIAVASLFVCKLCLPNWSQEYYYDSFVTQPWHNSTYILMKLFGFISLGLFFIIEKEYLEKISIKRIIFFTISLILVNFSKPNFIIGFAPIMLIVLIIDFIKEKGKCFLKCFIFGMCVLISCIILLYETKYLFPSGSNNGIAISFNHMFSVIFKDRKFIIRVILNFAFPIYIYILMIRNKEKIDSYAKKVYYQTLFMYILSFFEMLLLVETGDRFDDGNFGWGGLFFSNSLFIVSYCILYYLESKKIISKKEYYVGNFIFISHILFGLSYTALIFFLQSPYYV